MDNIRNDVTVPVNLSARKSIKSEVAKALYNRIDSILAKMDRHEKSARNLIKEYDLKADRYKYKSQRKSFAEVIVRNLNGIPLSSINAYLYVEIQETNDKQDWKCVFTKRATRKQVPTRRNKIENRDPQYREYLIDLIERSVG